MPSNYYFNAFVLSRRLKEIIGTFLFEISPISRHFRQNRDIGKRYIALLHLRNRMITKEVVGEKQINKEIKEVKAEVRK